MIDKPPAQPVSAEKVMALYEPMAIEEPPTVLPARPAFRVIGQLAKTYILVENDEGLMVVDQHIAAERVNFERFAEQTEKSEAVSQHLLVPMEFPITPVLAASLEENRGAFEKLGFSYELGSRQVTFQQIPSLYHGKVLKQSLEGLLVHLENTGEVKLSFDDVIATAACHSSVRAGDPLHHDQMERIISQWLACKRPWTCPHGRPVFQILTHREIMAFFDRPSLPV